MTTEQPSPPEETYTDPETGLPLSELFWRSERPRTLSENMTRGAIFMKWNTGAIGGCEALRLLEEFELVDYDRMIEAYARHLAAGGEG